MKKVGVALLGLGVVGGGTYTILRDKHDYIAENEGIDIEIRCVLEKNLDRARELGVDPAIVTTDIERVLGDPDIAVVAEFFQKTRSVDFARTEEHKILQVRRRSVAFVRIETVARIFAGKLVHQRVPRDFRDNRSRRDSQARRVALDDRCMGIGKFFHRLSVDENARVGGIERLFAEERCGSGGGAQVELLAFVELAGCARHCKLRRAQNVELFYLVDRRERRFEIEPPVLFKLDKFCVEFRTLVLGELFGIVQARERFEERRHRI